MYLVDISYDDEVYLANIFSNPLFCRALYSDQYHSSKILDHPIMDWFEHSYEVIDIFGHSLGGMIVHSIEKKILVYLGFLWSVTCYFLFIFRWIYIFMYNL